MKIFKLTELLAVGEYGYLNDIEAHMNELLNFPNPDYKLVFCIRSPKLPIYKFSRESSERKQKDKSLYPETGEIISPDFLQIDQSNIRTDGSIELSYFIGAYDVKTPTDETSESEVELLVDSPRIYLFNECKTTNTFNEQEIGHLAISFLSLYVGAVPSDEGEVKQGDDDSVTTEGKTKADSIASIKDLRHALGIYEEFPKALRVKLEAFPEINDEHFHYLASLRDVYNKYWTNYAFKDYLLLRTLEPEDIKADHFLRWNYSDVDKKIRSRIRFFDGIAATEILRQFVNSALKKGSRLDEGTKREEILKMAEIEGISADGKTPGEKCAKIAAKLIQPSFEKRSDGRFKRSLHKLYPVKLWFLHQIALFFWGNIASSDHKSHPLNKNIKALVLALNQMRLQDEMSEDQRSILNQFLHFCPELKHLPKINFTDDEAKYAATMIKPNWGYSKNRKI